MTKNELAYLMVLGEAVETLLGGPTIELPHTIRSCKDARERLLEEVGIKRVDVSADLAVRLVAAVDSAGVDKEAVGYVSLQGWVEDSLLPSLADVGLCVVKVDKDV